MKRFSRENIIFSAIIFIASIMRFWNYWNWSFTHDELGAFVRLNYSSFSELIELGVQNQDTHPAFTQLFIFAWAKLFGLSEASIRLPFVLAGIGSVAVLFFLAKKWFGTTTAYFSSLSLALLEFPILYSQLARPYSFGLFFSLLTALCWTNLLFGTGRRIYLKAICYGIATVLCMLTHYFAFFLALIVALTGFFVLKKETWKPYLLSGVIAIMIFLPHISISLHQFGMGGIGDWLAKPGKDFLWKHVLYSLNDSPIVVVAIAIVSVLSILIYHLQISFSPQGVLRTKFQAICLVWFLLPFSAGYYYSVYVNPVLQHSTLLFSFPFLLLFFFSFFPKEISAVQIQKNKFNNIELGSWGVILLFSTVIEKKLYKREDFGIFEEINLAAIKLQKKYGAENITTALNTTSKDIFDFYFQKKNESVSYTFYAGDDSTFTPNFLKQIDTCTTPYFLYGWSNFKNPFEIAEIIKRKYPCIIYDERHFNSQVTLFTKNDSCKRDTITYTYLGFEFLSPDNTKFGYDSTGIDTLTVHSGKLSLRVKPKNKFSITYRTTVKRLFKDNAGCVNISFWIYTEGEFNAQLVMDIGQPIGKRDWKAKLLPKFIEEKGQWQQVFATFELPASAYPDDEVKILLWNRGKNSFFLDDVVISSFADSKYDPYAPSFRK